MGNKTSVSNHRKLKVAEYPIDIAENQWITSGMSDMTIQSKQSKEVKLISSQVERRIRAEPNDYKDFDMDEKQISDNIYNYKNPINNIVQLRIQFPNKPMIGSGVIIHHSLYRTFILTAAHNVVCGDENDDKNVIYAESIWIDTNKNKKDNGFDNIKRYDCCEYNVHPKYIKYLKDIKIKESQTGYDIAVIEVLDPQKELCQIKKVKLVSYNSEMTDNIKVKVIGYPGEEHLRGELYGMMGNAEIKYTHKTTRKNKLIAYNNIDTTGGQSGCPIFSVRDSDNDEKYSENVYKSLDEIAGIHIAGKQQQKLNFGTLLNDELVQWIYECVPDHYNKYKQYKVGVLLFTSSKTKYGRRLNQIYAKCLKTEIIHTIRLYYDYETEERVNKNDILFYFKQFIKSKRNSYIIFYCGESDTNGNWIINKNKFDNISLNEINMISNTKPDYSLFYIVSDCNYSGNWVKIFEEKNIFKNINAIQASSKNNKICNAGTFTSKYSQCCFEYANRGALKAVGGEIGRLITGIVGVLTVVPLYDTIIKQPYHIATKQSQPTTTKSIETNGIIFQLGVDKWHTIGCSRDGIYGVNICFYYSWNDMDTSMTLQNGGTIGSVGTIGYY